jgi:hypothetical protein
MPYNINRNAVNAAGTIAGVCVAAVGIWLTVGSGSPAKRAEAAEAPPQSRPKAPHIAAQAPLAHPDTPDTGSLEDFAAAARPKRVTSNRRRPGIQNNQLSEVTESPTTDYGSGPAAFGYVGKPDASSISIPEADMSPGLDDDANDGATACSDRDWAFRNGSLCSRDQRRQTVISTKEWRRVHGPQDVICEFGFDLYRHKNGDYGCFRAVN